VSNILDNNVQADWDAIADATNYTVRYKPIGCGQNYTTETAPSNVANVVDALGAGTIYKVGVRSNCSGAQSTWSGEVIFTTGGDCTPSVDGYGATFITPSTAVLNWGDVVCPNSYTVQYREVGTTLWTQLVNPNNTSEAVGGLTAPTNYEYQVNAVCNTGNASVFSASVLFSTDCLAPTGLAISNIQETSAQADWDAVSPATDYTIGHRLSGSGDDYTTQAASSNVAQAVTGLANSQEYELSVRTNCGLNSSDWSGEELFTTSSPAPRTGVVSEEPITFINLYPNPVADVLNIEYMLSEGEDALLEVFDMYGRKVTATEVASAFGSLQLQTGHLPNGQYLLQITNGKEMAVKKFVVFRP
jgi:hypothetical protein